MTDDKKLANEKEDERQPTEGEVTAKKVSPPWPVITVAVFISVLLLALAAVSWLWVQGAVTSNVRDMQSRLPAQERQFGYDTEERHERWYGGFGNMTAPAASGVVTKIDGDTLTVAGYGKAISVKTTDETIVSGDGDTVEVNDTVVVTGDTDDDGTVTATRVIIRNEPAGRPQLENRRTPPNA